MAEFRQLFERHTIPEGLKIADMALKAAFTMAPVEVVGARFLIRDPVTHDVVRNLEDLMAHGNDRDLVARMAFDAVIARLQGLLRTRVVANMLCTKTPRR